MASQILGVIAGVVVGYFTESPQAGFAAYAAVAGVSSYLNQPDRMGPRLEDLRTQMSVYGNPIPFEYGCNRHAGTVIWPSILEAQEHQHSESAKGGPDQVTFTYTLSFGILVCEGPIAGIRRIWANKKLIYDVSLDNSGATQDPAISGLRFYLGTDSQDVDPLIEATDGPSPAYLGYAYVVFENYDVTEMNGRVPQFEFEVVASGSNDLPAATTFGEYVGIGPADATFRVAYDHNGIWLTTLTGHAVFDEESGEYVFDPEPTLHGRWQIQQYDPFTHQLLWAYDIPLSDVDPFHEYLISGEIVCSGGFLFIGRGTAGVDGTSYPFGVIVNTSTREVQVPMWECSNNGFNDAFYWPTVPIPVLENNKVYFASGNGLFGGGSIALMPASDTGADSNYMVSNDPSDDTHYVPDFSTSPVLWNAPQQWRQSRGLLPCPIMDAFDGVGITLPNWCYKSTMATNPHAVIVQGYGDSTHSAISWVSHSPRVTDFDLNAASIHVSGLLPGSPVLMPAVCWDPVNEVIWAFAKGTSGSDNYSALYEITVNTGDLLVADSGFEFPLIGGELQSNDVKGMCYDEATGYLRLILGGGFDDPAYLVLFDPVTQSTIQSIPIGLSVPAAYGVLYDFPEEKKVFFSSGYQIFDIPYGNAVEPEQVTLASIVSDISLRTDLTEDDIDVTELEEDLVDGYLVARQTAARSAIEPLQTAYFFDAVESDDKIKFVKRGASAVVTTIPLDDRAAHEAGQEMPDGLSIRRAFELELPYQADVEYADIDADHLIGNQYDRRITKDTRQRINLQLPITMTASKAKQVARVNLYDAWQNQTYRWTTTRKYAYLEPTDIVDLPTASATYRAIITNRRDQPNGIIEWEGRIQSLEIFDQTGDDALTPPYTPQTVFEASTTVLELLDIPLLRDEDDNAGYYVAMGGEL